MNILKKLLMAVLVLTGCSMGMMAQKKAIAVKEPSTREAIMNYLRVQGFSPKYFSDDNSINFKWKKEVYWITTDRKEKVTRYTVHCFPVEFKKNPKDPGRLNRQREVAAQATNAINASHDYKMFLKGNSVNIEFPIYASNVKDFLNVFPDLLLAMENAKRDFQKSFRASRAVCDSIHGFWMNNDTTIRVMKQPAQNVAIKKHNANIKIISTSARNVTSGGSVISDYDQGLRTSKMEFLQPKITYTASNKGTFKIGVKIYTPDKKLLLPAKDARYTIVSTVTVKKTDKELEQDLDIFGSKEKDAWEPGEYIIEYYEDDIPVYNDAFNLL